MENCNYWDMCYSMKITNTYVKIKLKNKNKNKNENENCVNNVFLDNLKNLSCLLQI